MNAEFRNVISDAARRPPESGDRGFAEPGRDIHARREFAGGQKFEQPALPRKRVVAGQGLEIGVEFTRTHRASLSASPLSAHGRTL